jgi:hypothetical protein
MMFYNFDIFDDYAYEQAMEEFWKDCEDPIEDNENS